MFRGEKFLLSMFLIIQFFWSTEENASSSRNDALIWTDKAYPFLICVLPMSRIFSSFFHLNLVWKQAKLNLEEMKVEWRSFWGEMQIDDL